MTKINIRFDETFKEQDVPLADVLGKVHKFAMHTPLKDEQSFQGFKQDIHDNGQLEPIKLFRGQIVDGRHRVRALHELGSSTVRAKQLHYQSTDAEICQVVDSGENRRHETATQLAIRAYRMTQREVNRRTQEQAAFEVGVSGKQVKAVSAIMKYRPMLVDDLFNGEAFQYMVDGKQKVTTSLQTIAKIVKTQDKTTSATEAERLSEESYAKVNTMVGIVQNAINTLSTGMSQVELQAAFERLALPNNPDKTKLEHMVHTMLLNVSTPKNTGIEAERFECILEDLSMFSKLDLYELLQELSGLLWDYDKTTGLVKCIDLFGVK